ncbi:hypothetical protein SLA2020_499100 [Shorea laevis]
MTGGQYPHPSTQEANLLNRSVKTIKGDDHPTIEEDYHFAEVPTQLISYRDLVMRNEPIIINYDTVANHEYLEQDSDIEDDGEFLLS